MRFLDIKSLFFSLKAAVILFFVASCNNGVVNTADNSIKFTINGTIENAQGKTLYLANTGIDRTLILDSAVLDASGNFEFKQPAPESFEFYLLSFADSKPMALTVDSTENITITADGNDLWNSYTVAGSSESVKIKELQELQSALEKQIMEMKPDASFLARKSALIEEFKENVAKEYIIPSPDKASAYFALWLTYRHEQLFNPIKERKDSKYFAAVATSMQRLYPNAKRTQHLCAIAKQGIKATRKITTTEIEAFEALAQEANASNIFDINLPDREGDSIRLSSLTNKVVLLDFTIFGNNDIKMRNIDLREMYDKFSKKGLEIYQVSLDSREHFWQQETPALPWICVRDGRGSASPYLATYNVQSIPTFFLINKKGEIMMRDAQIKDIKSLEKEIAKLLKE